MKSGALGGMLKRFRQTGSPNNFFEMEKQLCEES
jgi:hypothetical protein